LVSSGGDWRLRLLFRLACSLWNSDQPQGNQSRISGSEIRPRWLLLFRWSIVAGQGSKRTHHRARCDYFLFFDSSRMAFDEIPYESPLGSSPYTLVGVILLFSVSHSSGLV